MHKKLLLLGILFFSLQLLAQTKDSTYHRDVIWKQVISDFEKMDAEHPPKPNSILFVGSSSFTNWQDVNSYFPDKNIINRSFGGSELKDLIYYFNRIILPYRPSQIVLYEGDNDITFGMTAEEYVDDVKTFVRMVEIYLPGTPILVLSIKKSEARSHYSIEFNRANALLYAYAQTKPWVQFVDVTEVLFDHQGDWKKDCFMSDNLHISTKGYQLWAQLIEPYLVN